MVIKTKYLIFITLVITVIVIGVSSTLFLPEKYFFDANKIAFDPYNEKGFIGSYPVTMMFYHLTHLNKLHYSIIALLQLSIIFLMIKKIGIPDVFGKFVLRNTVIWAAILMFAVYLSMPSKEFLTFIFVATISYILISRLHIYKKVFYVCVLLIVFGLWFRPYFVLMPFLSIGLYGISKIRIRNKVLNIILGGLFIAFFMSFSYGFIKGEFMSQELRENLNKRRIGREDSQTIILAPVKADNAVGESISIVHGFFSVNFPINGLKHFKKPHVLAFVFWQLLLFSYLVYFYRRCIRRRHVYRESLWVFHFVFSYLIIQGIFEPDLGSAVKHKLGVFPLLYLAFYYDQQLIQKSNKAYKFVIKGVK